VSEPDWIYAFEEIDNPNQKLCRNCDETYKSYVIFVADSKQAAIIHTHLEKQCESLCGDCRESLSKEGAKKGGKQ
jgi:hypothetical protein